MNTIANFCVREFSSLAFTISSPSLCVNAVCYYEWLFSILKNIILFRFFFLLSVSDYGKSEAHCSYSIVVKLFLSESTLLFEI